MSTSERIPGGADEPKIVVESLAGDELEGLLGEVGELGEHAEQPTQGAGERHEDREPPPRTVRFERHVGSGYPLRAVYPDGSWLAVNRTNQGLFSGDARGRIVQLLPNDQFFAVSPRQFVTEYQRVFGQTLHDRDEALGPVDVERLKR